jgi:hypothetical protein
MSSTTEGVDARIAASAGLQGRPVREVPPNQLLLSRRLHRPYRESVRWIVDGMNVIGARPNGWW